MTTEDAIAKIEVYEAKPGDVLIIQCPSKLSTDQAQSIIARAKGVFKGTNVVILDSGMTVTVVRQGEELPAGAVGSPFAEPDRSGQG